MGAKVAGLKVKLFDNIFLVVLSLAIIGSLQSVGIILVLSMLLTPAAAAKLIMKSFTSAMVIGSVFGIIASVSGLYLSYYLDFPSGPSMALAATLIFVIAWILRRTINYAI
jgi:manganese/iron transport system permease protein